MQVSSAGDQFEPELALTAMKAAHAVVEADCGVDSGTMTAIAEVFGSALEIWSRIAPGVLALWQLH